jgi:single-stranded DNA-specific DHH superfamily exonuclease
MFYEKLDCGKVKSLLEETGRKILVYHRDADGVCSASLVLKFFPDFETITREGPIIDDKFFKELEEKKPDVLVFLDIPVDQEWKKLKKLMAIIPETKMMIIDHHIVEKDMNDAGIIHVNPRFCDKNLYCPASYVVYKIFRKLGMDVEKYVWISVIGVIGDYGFEDCEDVLKECIRIYPQFMKVVEMKGGNGLGKAAEMISAAITLKGSVGAEKSLKHLVKYETVEDLYKSESFRKWHVIVQKEIKSIMKDFAEKKEYHEDKKLVLYEIKSRLNITSVIATAITEIHKDDVVIIRKGSPMGWKISLRCQNGKVNVGDLAKYASKKIGSGGGHPKSAGSLVNSWEEFKKRAFEFLEKKG